MSDATPQPMPAAAPSDTRTLAIIVYGLYIAAVFTCGVAGIAGAILAYIKRDESVGTIWHSHFENAIQAFWIWFVLFVVGVATSWILIGIPIIAVAFLYFLYRSIRGLLAAVESRPYV
jgi:uncharacterized membrane protein